jgi:hypothetical protein
VVGRGDLYRHPPTFGLRQAGIAEAVARTRAFRMYDYSLVVLWYALDGRALAALRAPGGSPRTSPSNVGMAPRTGFGFRIRRIHAAFTRLDAVQVTIDLTVPGHGGFGDPDRQGGPP